MNALRIVPLAVLATAVCITSVCAQTITRVATTLWDKSDSTLGGSGNKQRIVLRVWHERFQHADGNYAWYLNYEVAAVDRNFWGAWKPANKLASISFAITSMPGVSGTIPLNNASSAKGILYDGGSMSPALVPVVTGATVSAVRSGGSSGITVTVTH